MCSFRDGRLRGFAFVGYGSAKEAREAAKYFDHTFVDTSRIQVELAKPMGDPSLDRPWSKYSSGSSAFAARQATPAQLAEAKQKQAAERARLKGELAKKKKFLMSIYGEDEAGAARFVSAMKSKSRTKTWENDDDAFAAPARERPARAPKVKVSVSAVASRKSGTRGDLVEQVHLQFESSSEEEDAGDADGHGDYQKAFGGSDTDDDLYEEAGSAAGDAGAEPAADTAEARPGPAELSPELIAETGRLFVRNLSYAVSEEDLRALFEPFGMLTEVHLPIGRETKRPKGFAYILFMIPENALKAYSTLDRSIFQGRILHILPSLEKPVRDTSAATGFQATREQQQRAQASKDYNWNSLFIRPDTILDAIAAQLGVPKAEIMDARADGLATRLAIAETHLVQDTKAYLEAQGVVLDVFSTAPSARSDTVLLVKNLPFDTDTAELRRLFSPFGSLGRVILPPATRAIALVEFLEASEARTAFKALAYSKFRNVPLFLEWAPVAVLRPAAAEPPTAEVVTVAAVKAEDLFETGAAAEGAAHNSCTLYVTNLSWSTPADTLKQVFAAAGPVKSVKLATKKGPTGATLSLGFGFVEFERRESLNRALDSLQGTVVDGHALVLKRSTSDRPADKAAKAKGRPQADLVSETASTKLIVRNIPFEAAEKEVRDLFKSFSHVKRIRLPRKFDGQHRGFGFIEFLSHQEARNALQSLAHTHLYGRHLVLEWAKEGDEDLEAVRDRMAQRSISGGAPPARKRTRADRINLDQDEDGGLALEPQDD